MSDVEEFALGIAADLIAALEPLTRLASSLDEFEQTLVQFGWDPAGVDLSPVRAAFDVTTDLAAVADQLGTLDINAVTNDPAALAPVLTAAADLVKKIRQLASSPPSGVPAPFDSTAFWDTFPLELLQLLFVTALERRNPALAALLGFVGAIDDVAVDAVPPRAAYTRREISLSKLADFISSPATHMQTEFEWGTGKPLQHGRLLLRIYRLLSILGPFKLAFPREDLAQQYWSSTAAALPTLQELSGPLFTGSDGQQQLITFTASLFPIPAKGTTTGDPVGVTLALSGDTAASFPASLDLGPFTLLVEGGFQASGGLALDVRPGSIEPRIQTAGGSIDASITIRRSAAGTPLVLIGEPGGSRLQVGDVEAQFAASGSPSDLELIADFTLRSLAVVLQFQDGDSFLRSIFGANPQTLTADMKIEWSSKHGFSFTAGGALRFTIGIHVELAIVRIETITIELVAQTGKPITLNVAADGSLVLGPLDISVTGVGIRALATPQPVPQPPGNLGDLNLELGFKPPSGLALSLDADPVSGVGFIAFDEADARYLGALALAVGDVSIDAVGVLDTRLPGGAQGYSLVVVASATFPPVQLGFGFSLDGIGGLVGVNRTADVPSLQAAARAGQLDDLMFPPDIIHRAPQVAANLAREFPAAQGHFIIGPAVRLAWGADGMVEAAVGVFIELSDAGGGISLLRVALLGSVHLTLPEPIDPVADLTLDVLGLVDIPAKTLSLDAGLRNSTIAGFPLTGQAALRAGWGADPAFVFAIGGFNPHFAAPAGFPSLQRVTLAIGDDSASLVLSSYLALTSNTLQLGCAADLHAVQGSAAVTASLSFDALVQFKPFGLIVDLTITATVLLDGNAIMTLDLDLHLTGPDPWQVTGEASFHFLFCSFSVPVAITVGPQPPPAAPVTVDLDSNLTTALAAPGSWQTGPPPGQGLVKVRAQDKAHPAVHPLGSLTVRQHAVPLGQRVDRYGPDLLEKACTYQITAPTLSGQPAQAADAKDFFAPAQFLTMHSDAEKLSAPSFEQMIAGATLGSTDLTVPRAPGSTQGTDVVVDTPSTKPWNMLILDSPNPVTTTGGTATASTTAPAATVVSSSQQVPLDGTMLAAQLPGAAAAVNGAGGRGQALYTRPGLGNGIAVEQPAYAIAGMNLAAFGPARLSLLRIPTAAAAPSTIDTGQRGQDWQVIYASEMAGS